MWGSAADEPVARVLEALADRSVPAEHLDDRTIPTLRYDLLIAPRPSGWFEIDGRRIDLAEVDGVYLRPGEQSGRASAVSAALLAVMGGLPAVVVNRPVASRSNLSKPFQLGLLAAAGLATPDTLVTTDMEAARTFLDRHGRIVYKSISGIRSVVSAIDRRDADRLDRIGHGPVQLQQWIDGVDVRVHVVGDRWFATSVTSDATDYRYATHDGDSVVMASFTLPEGLGPKLVTVTRDLGLVVSGVDLRRTPSGDWYCFEVNPSPGFTYYEAHTGQPIAGAIADLLAAGGDA